MASDTERLRARMERAVERLISALDALDTPSEDLEEQGDLEPDLAGSGSDLEYDPAEMGEPDDGL